MYDALTVHAAHDRLTAMLRERNEFQTAKGNPFTARTVGADIELKTPAGGQRRVNFGEFTMFMRCAHKMSTPDMTEFKRFTDVAPALLALVDAVVATGTPRPVVSLRDAAAAAPAKAATGRLTQGPPSSSTSGYPRFR